MIPLGIFNKAFTYQNVALNKTVTLTKGTVFSGYSAQNLTKGYRKVLETDPNQSTKIAFFKANSSGQIEFEIYFETNKQVDLVRIFSGYDTVQHGDDLGNSNAPTTYNFTSANFQITGVSDGVIYPSTISSTYMAEEYNVFGVTNNALKLKFQTVIAPNGYLSIVGIEAWGNN